MRLLKPSEISGSILNLLEESDQWVLIVSPYMQISKWYRMLSRIKGLRSRGIIPMIYVRDDPDNRSTYLDLERQDLPYRKIPHLHSKLYLNENHGIVTSMNLLLSSELRSLEIGYITECSTEHQALMDYCWRYITSFDPAVRRTEPVEFQDRETAERGPLADLQALMKDIRAELAQASVDAWAYCSGNCISVCTGRNNYQISVSSGSIRITAWLHIPSRAVLASTGSVGDDSKSAAGSARSSRPAGDGSKSAAGSARSGRPAGDDSKSAAGSARSSRPAGDGSKSAAGSARSSRPAGDDSESASGSAETGRAENIVKKIGEISGIKVSLIEGAGHGRCQLSGQAVRKMKSHCIKGLLKGEEAYLKDVLLNFIRASHSW